MSRRRRSLLDNKPRLAGVTPTPAPEKETAPSAAWEAEETWEDAAEDRPSEARYSPPSFDEPDDVGEVAAPQAVVERWPPVEEEPTQHYWGEDDTPAAAAVLEQDDEPEDEAPLSPTAAWVADVGRRAATPVPAPAVAPRSSAWLDLPSGPIGAPSHDAMEVAESGYVDTGTPPQDVEAHGWDRSVHAPLEERFRPIPGDLPPAPDDLFDFGGWDDRGLDPPTEDVPAAVMEDLAQGYSAPMNVPEPPPVPGIIDRYTPPPVPRSQGPGRPGKPAFAPTPAPTGRRVVAVDDDDDDDGRSAGRPFGMAPQVLIAGGVGVFGVVALLLAIVLVVVTLNRAPEPELPASRLGTVDATTPEPPVPTRPGLGEVPVPEVVPETAPAPAAPETAPSPAPAAPAPVGTAPRPAPPKPAPRAEEPVAKSGTMRIRANRKVLIYIDGRPEDYAPLELKMEPGVYSISAALPGRPETEKVVRVDLGAGKIERVEFTF